MYELMFTMLERVGIIVTVAFVLTRLRFSRHLIHRQKMNTFHQVSAMVFFGFFGIIGTYTGIALNIENLDMNSRFFDIDDDEAIANSRVIGIVIAGLLGGYKVGIGAGLIAGLHRFSLGGFTAFSCGISAIVAGLLAATIRAKFPKYSLNPMTAFITGALAEAIQMSIILLTAKPFEHALTLVKEIGMPMIIANGIGSLLFLLIIQTVFSEEEKVGALQAQKALRLAELTLSHLRKGLNPDSAKTVCEILYKEVDSSAIAITNTEKILAHIGLADDHHKMNLPIQTDITKRVLREGKLLIADHDDIHCKNLNCPLTVVVIAPLKLKDKTIGTLKFYFESKKSISNIHIQLIQGLSSLLSNQLEISEVENAYQIAKDMEIKALQAQINPHFLFNSMNTIVSLIRIEPAKARKLLISLSNFFRQNLTATTTPFILLEKELTHVKSYLEIEETRFVDRLHVTYTIDDAALNQKIPALTLQPIVENSIKHGFKDKEKDCHIEISIKKDHESVYIGVKDNGLGMAAENLIAIGQKIASSDSGTGIGLYNINRRLIMMFGEASRLKVESDNEKGTFIHFALPIDYKGGKNDDENESAHY